MAYFFSRSRPVAILLTLGVLTGSALLTFGAPLPAIAHTELISSNPEAGSTTTDVSDIALTFGEEVVPDYTTLTLTDASGTPLNLSVPTVDATHTIVSAHVVSAPLADGTYSVAYYVVSIDGHPVEGNVGFSVSGSPIPSPTETPSSATPSAEPLVTETPVPIVGEARLFSSSSATPDMTWVWVGTGVAAVVVLGAVSAVLLIALRRQRDNDPTT